MVEMKSKFNIFFLVLIVFSTIIFPVSIKGQTSQTIYPLKDAFVGDLNPNENTGDDAWLWISEDMQDVGTCWALIYFELPSDYGTYDRILFRFYIVLGVGNSLFNVNLYRINEFWNESTITWDNKPLLGEFVMSRPLDDRKTYQFDIKEHLQTNVFSICIKASYLQFELGQIPSKESDMGNECIPAIKLINTSTGLDSISSFPIFIFVFSFIVPIIIIARKKSRIFS